MNRKAKMPTCGICGSQMVKDNGGFKCKICEYFFEMSSDLKKCSQCEAEYGSYPAVERKIRDIGSILTTSKDKKLVPLLCPECRRKIYPLAKYTNIRSTFVEMIGAALAKRDLTPSGLEYYLQGVTTKVKEFVDYCSSGIFKGEMKMSIFNQDQWGRGDSNPHVLRHQILNLTRLPIPALPQRMAHEIKSCGIRLSAALKTLLKIPFTTLKIPKIVPKCQPPTPRLLELCSSSPPLSLLYHIDGATRVYKKLGGEVML